MHDRLNVGQHPAALPDQDQLLGMDAHSLFSLVALQMLSSASLKQPFQTEL